MMMMVVCCTHCNVYSITPVLIYTCSLCVRLQLVITSATRRQQDGTRRSWRGWLIDVRLMMLGVSLSICIYMCTCVTCVLPAAMKPWTHTVVIFHAVHIAYLPTTAVIFVYKLYVLCTSRFERICVRVYIYAREICNVVPRAVYNCC